MSRPAGRKTESLELETDWLTAHTCQGVVILSCMPTVLLPLPPATRPVQEIVQRPAVAFGT